MDILNEHNQNLILKHLRKETSPGEEEELSSWLDQAAENRVLYNEVAGLWKLTEYSEAEFEPDVESAWESVKAKANLDPKHQTASAKGEAKIVSFNVNMLFKIAASLLLLITIGWFLRGSLSDTEEMITLSTGEESKEYILPDSSKIWLNRHSSLTYSKDFNGDRRNVLLRGEAFFEVRRDSLRPFIVSGNISKTEVLGTSFNIRAYTSQPEEIEVYSGKVSFSNKDDAGQKVLLLAGHKAVAQKDGLVEKQDIGHTNAASWKSQEMVFDNSRMKEVVASMERHFDVDIVLDKNLSDCRFTGTFVQPDLDEALAVLEVAMEVRINNKNGEITISGQGCPE